MKAKKVRATEFHRYNVTPKLFKNKGEKKTENVSNLSFENNF